MYAASVKSKIIPLVLLFTYLIVRFLLIGKLDALLPYGSYLFELFFVAVTIRLYWQDFRIKFKPNKTFLIELLLALIAGFIVYKMAGWAKIAIPFNLSDHTTIILLLFVGPILEELLFREALWNLLEKVFCCSVTTLILSSLLFSFGHFFAYFSTPEYVHNFIYYQSLYTLLIALWWGYRKMRTKEITTPIIMHAVFNFGFYLAFLI